MATESTDDGADTIIQAFTEESGENLLKLVEFNIVGQQWALERLSHFYPAMGRVANCHRMALMAFKAVAKEIHEQEQTKEHDEKAPSAKKMPRPVGKGGSGSGMDGPDGDDGKGRDAKGKGGSVIFIGGSGSAASAPSGPVGKGGSGSGMDGPDGHDGKGRDAKGKGGSDGKGAAAKSKDRDSDDSSLSDGDSDDSSLSSPSAKRRNPYLMIKPDDEAQSR